MITRYPGQYKGLLGAAFQTSAPHVIFAQIILAQCNAKGIPSEGKAHKFGSLPAPRKGMKTIYMYCFSHSYGQ